MDLNVQFDAAKAFNDHLRPALDVLHALPVGASGALDTEGRVALQEYVRCALSGEPPPRITFEYLQCYSSHKPSDQCPFNKTQVAAQVRAAAKQIAAAYRKALRAQGIRTPLHKYEALAVIDATW